VRRPRDRRPPGRPHPAALRVEGDGQCISLGRKDGLIQFVNPDDSPRGPVLTGRLVALVKESIVRGAAFGQRHPALALVAASRALA
jgi:NADH dehydrogenase